MKQYEEYKDSGVVWVGKIPKDWEVRRLKYILSTLESGGRHKNSEKLTTGAYSIGGEHIDKQGNLFLDNLRYITIDYYKQMKTGQINVNDILLVKDGATIGKTTIVQIKPFSMMSVNEHVFILRSNKNTNAIFLFYLIKSSIGQEQIILEIRGSAQPGLNSQFTSKTIFPIPPLEEQEGIATYLDYKVGVIDDLIFNKKKQVELLKEKKQAIINYVVTKGLNSDVELKETNIEYIGTIPKHWKTTRLNNIGCFSKGYGISKSKIQETGLQAILYGDIYTMYEIKTKIGLRFISQKTSKESILLNKGDLLLTGSGETREDIGKCIAYIGDNPTYAGGDIIIFKPKLDNSIFLSYVLNSIYFISQKMLYAKGDIIIHIYSSSLRDIKIVLPPIEDQEKIADYLDHKTSIIDQGIEKIKKSITLLEEYKTSLISHIVTGKIKVTT